MNYVKTNDSLNNPLTYTGEDGSILGQFYNSWDGTYHLASYVPYKQPPYKYVCGGVGNFSPSRSEHERKKCPHCFAAVETAEVV